MGREARTVPGDAGRAAEAAEGRQAGQQQDTGAAGYEVTGRTRQKARTRALLLEQARQLMARGPTPSVHDVAVAAGISRTTAYRYFPSQIDLVRAAHPEIEAATLLPNPAPAQVPARLDAVLDGHFRILRDWEPQLRASLRLSLEPGGEQPILRRGRAVQWIRDALGPLSDTHPHLDVGQLAVQLRAAVGIEAYVWLVDVASVPAQDALTLMRATARAVLAAAMAAGRDGREPVSDR